MTGLNSKKNIITSLFSPRVKEIVRLRDSKYRRVKKLFIIEGARELGLALSSGIKLCEAYVCFDFLKGEKDALYGDIVKRGIKIIEVDKEVYSKIAFGERKEGIVGIASFPRLTLDKTKLKENPFVVVTERIEKPGNLGAIMRTIDAFGVDALVVSDPMADVYNPNVIRSSTGTVFTINVCQMSSEAALAWFKSMDFSIICAAPKAKINYASVDFRGSSAVVFGSEEKGISKFWLDNADIIASIPMKGKADSLNVSISAAVFISEALKQRGIH